MTKKTLWCKAGEHEWERTTTKGRAPQNCPEHKEQKIIITKKTPVDPEPVKRSMGNQSGLEKAQAIQREKRMKKEKEWAKRINAAVNDPRMTYSMPAWGDARKTTVSKLLYIQNELQFNRAAHTPGEISDLEKMREKIMKDPFSRNGHLL